MRRTLIVIAIAALLAATGLAAASYAGLIRGECHLYTVSIGLRFPEGLIEPDWEPATALTGVSVKADNLETDLMGHHLVLQKIQGGYLAVLDEYLPTPGVANITTTPNYTNFTHQTNNKKAEDSHLAALVTDLSRRPVKQSY